MIIIDMSILKKENEKATLEEASEIINKLEDELKLCSGYGLASPQIGINKQIAIIRIKYNEDIETKIDLVNPVIIEKYRPFVNIGEGCLSLPDIRVNVPRYKEVFIKDDLHPAGFVATDLDAVVIEHEIDHLYSILITDRAGKNKISRNNPCPCGRKINNKPVKFKNCCGR